MTWPEEFEVSVEFESDWHIGTGAGRHHQIDQTIVRDWDGYPYLPAKTLVGVLRDQAEIAASALDEPGTSIWRSWLEFLFGSQPSQDQTGARPQRAALQAQPLRFPKSLRDTIDQSPGGQTQLSAAEMRAAAVTVRVGVSIDPATGVAKDDCLRFEERAISGLTLSATWALALDDAAAETDVWPAQLLLGSAAKMVTAIGGKRRRGAGKATVRIAGIDPARLEVLFDRLDSGNVPEWPKATSTRPSAVCPAPRGDLVHRHDVRVVVETPVLVDATVRGNIVTSATEIPGAALMHIVAKGLDVPLPGLIRAGGIVVTPALPEYAGARTLPWPRAITKSKDDELRQHNPLDLINRLQPHEPHPRLKSPEDRYIHVPGHVSDLVSDPGGPCVAVTVDRIERIHAVIEDATQRPTEQTGGLFVYQGISPGTVLQAQVWLPAGVELDAARVDGVHTVGRSHKDDYGRVSVQLLDASGTAETTALSKGQPFTVWATSDIVLIGESGAPEPCAQRLAEVLGEGLGVEVSVAATFPGVTRCESWQTAWGFPRPSIVALSAGSVVMLIPDADVDAATVAAVVAAGLGDRRAEGYGRIAVNHRVLDRPKVPTITPPPPPPNARLGAAGPNPAHLSVAETATLDVLKLAAWRERIAGGVLVAARDAGKRAAFLPREAGGAQLGTLRELVGVLQPDGTGRDGFHLWSAGVRSIAKRGQVWNPVIEELDKLLGSPLDHTHPVWQRLAQGPPQDLASDETVRVLTVEAVKLLVVESIRVQIDENRIPEQAPT